MMILFGIVLAVVLIAAVGAISTLDSKDNEEAVMEKFCKLECICCQKRPYG